MLFILAIITTFEFILKELSHDIPSHFFDGLNYG